MEHKRNKLVDAKALLETLFEENNRPSLRWVRSQTKAKAIPHVRIGRLIFYDPDNVREQFAKKNTIRVRS